MHTFFTDKIETFECTLSLEGAELSNSKARLVLESNKYNLMFYGSIDSQGKCTIPVARLKNLLSESDTGKVKLEVIAEDTFFEPWSDNYKVKTSKKVTVEVDTKDTKPMLNEKKVSVSVDSSKSEYTNIQKTTIKNKSKLEEITNLFLKVAKRKNITAENFSQNLRTVMKICEVLTKKYNLQKDEPKQLAECIIRKIKN